MMEIGPFCVKSTLDPRPFCEGQIGIALPPTTSVYFPNHVSSQLSLEALVKYLKPGMSFLELGAGTCILSIAAEKLGAGRILATENHPDALEYAPRALEANGCTKVQLINGTFPDEEVDLCIANTDEGEKWVRKHLDKIKAKKIIAIDDKSSVHIVMKE